MSDTFRVTFRCGCPSIPVKRDVAVPPRCPACGERIVSRVTGATPTFKGACKGPLVKSA